MDSINKKLDEIFSPNGKKVFLLIICVAIIAGASYAFMPKTEVKAKKDVPSALASKTAAKKAPEIKPTVEESKSINPEPPKQEEIEVDVIDQSDVRMVSLNVEELGRSNPFLPSSESFTDLRKYGFELMAPPETIATDEAEAAKVMTTKVSGIMYQPNNPSAILNIEGEDYLVRSGDYINNYRVLSIDKDMVTVQLGANIHKARVGEMITDASVNHNNVYDLENKFGGSRK